MSFTSVVQPPGGVGHGSARAQALAARLTSMVAFLRLGRFCWERRHPLKQCPAVFFSQLSFKGMGQRTFQATLPTCTSIVKIGSATGQFACRVDLHPISHPHDTDKGSFGQDLPAANTSALRHMFPTNGFLLWRHVLSVRQYSLFPGLFPFGPAALALFLYNHCIAIRVVLHHDEPFLLALFLLLGIGFILSLLIIGYNAGDIGTQGK